MSQLHRGAIARMVPSLRGWCSQRIDSRSTKEALPVNPVSRGIDRIAVTWVRWRFS